MHCPRCNAVLTEREGKPSRCDPGQMDLSQDLERRLRECYVDNLRAPRSEPLAYRVGGSWFCPGCGVRALESTPGDLRCPSCQKGLAEFIYSLVELHPHEPSTRGS